MKGLLSKIEVLIGGALLLIFIVWAYSKCSDTKKEMQEEAVAAVADSLAVVETAQNSGTMPDDLRQKIAARVAADSLATSTPAATPGAAAAPTNATAPAEPEYNMLYVTIDKLKIRKQPGLKGELLGELKLFDRVYYLEEVTDSSYEVNLGKAVAKEPYVKVKTRRGTVGWVYGAGVHYQKKKREGVLE